VSVPPTISADGGSTAKRSSPARARDLGIRIGVGTPGEFNAITDVTGVTVGHATIIEGEGPLVVGKGPIRTGVTVIRPHNGHPAEEPIFAGFHTLNGNGEVTGLQWIKESGQLTSAIGLTNSHSVGVVRDTLAAIDCESRQPDHLYWSLPVAGETWDGVLNDINGFHVKPEHVRRAYAAARGGQVAEGSVGGGTGMICYMFKGGIGTASRVLPREMGGYTVGVLVQANFGTRDDYIVNGAPVGRVLNGDVVPLPAPPECDVHPPAGAFTPLPGAGSIVGIAATDAPLLPHQCDRLAQRVGLGVSRTGNSGDHWSGDIFVAFSTANRLPGSNMTWQAPLTTQVRVLSNNFVDPLFDAVVEATQEAILNAQLAAGTMVGRDGVTVHGLDPAALVDVLTRYDRMVADG
jgi:D-aminopeptidase